MSCWPPLACSALSEEAAGAEGESKELLSTIDSHQVKTVLNLGSCWITLLTEALVWPLQEGLVSLFPGITWTSLELGMLLVTASVSRVSLQCYYHWAAFPSPLVICCYLLSPLKITKSWYFTEGEDTLLPSPFMFPGVLHLHLFPSQGILQSFRLLVRGFHWISGGLLFLEVKKNSWSRPKCFPMLILTAYETE